MSTAQVSSGPSKVAQQVQDILERKDRTSPYLHQPVLPDQTDIRVLLAYRIVDFESKANLLRWLLSKIIDDDMMPEGAQLLHNLF